MMIKLNNTKLWVGDDPDLMKAVITILEQNGYPEHKEYNRSVQREACRGILISGGSWYFGKTFDTYNLVFYKEITLYDILPTMTSETIRNTYIQVSSEPQSRIVQEKLFELDCKWALGDKTVRHTNKRQLLINSEREITYSSTPKDTWVGRTRIFLHQLFLIKKQQHDTERVVISDTGPTGSRCLTGPRRTGRIASAERLVPYEIRAKQGKARIIGHLLEGAILTSGNN